MDDLITEWSASKHRPSNFTPRLGNNEELWQFVSSLLSMKRCAQGLEVCSDLDNVKSLKREQSRLVTESQSLNIATEQLMSDIKVLEKTTFDLKKNNSEVLDRFQQMSLKVQMMKTKSIQCLEEMRVIDGYSMRLEKMATDHINVGHKGHHGNESKGESVCTKEIQSCCIEFDKECTSDNKDDQKQARWTRVEPLLFRFPPKEIMESFISLTQQTTNELSQLSRPDMILTDHDEQQTQLQAVEKHIQEVQIQHIIKSQKLLKAENNLANAQKKLSGLMELWHEMIMTNYPSNEDDRTLLINWFQLSLEQNGYEAAVRELDFICNSMSHLCDERRKMVDDLKTKSLQIQQFRGVVEEKQSKIHSLVKHNSAAKERIKTQQTQILNYIDQKIRRHDNISMAVSNLQDQLLREVMLYTPHVKPRRSRLLDQKYDLDMNTIQAVSKCSEYVLVDLMDRLRTDHCLTLSADQIKMDVEQMERDKVNLEQAHVVLKESERFIEKHKKEFSNELESVLTCASKGVASVTEVQSLLEEWWSQPAQNVVQWQTVEDMNVNQWIEQWRILATKYMMLVQTEHLHLEDVVVDN